MTEEINRSIKEYIMRELADYEVDRYIGDWLNQSLMDKWFQSSLITEALLLIREVKLDYSGSTLNIF